MVLHRPTIKSTLHRYKLRLIIITSKLISLLQKCPRQLTSTPSPPLKGDYLHPLNVQYRLHLCLTKSNTHKQPIGYTKAVSGGRCWKRWLKKVRKVSLVHRSHWYSDTMLLVTRLISMKEFIVMNIISTNVETLKFYIERSS